MGGPWTKPKFAHSHVAVENKAPQPEMPAEAHQGRFKLALHDQLLDRVVVDKHKLHRQPIKSSPHNSGGSVSP
jgi:hypothetical protein